MLPIEEAVARTAGWPPRSIAFIVLPEGASGPHGLDRLPVALVNTDVDTDPQLIGSLRRQGYLVAGASFSGVADQAAPAGQGAAAAATGFGRPDQGAAAGRGPTTFASLTSRERRVLAEMIDGHRAQAIARRSGVSIATVRTQIHSILQKLGVNSQLAAVALARQASWTPTPSSPTPRAS